MNKGNEAYKEIIAPKERGWENFGAEREVNYKTIIRKYGVEGKNELKVTRTSAILKIWKQK